MLMGFQFLLRLLCLAAALVSVFGKDSCPHPTELPSYCACGIFTDGVHLYCEGLKHEDQLEQMINSTYWPTLNATEFSISKSPDLKSLTRNVFGEFTFETVILTDTGVEHISDSVFLNSKDTLLRYEVSYSNIRSSQDFPFNSMSWYTNLYFISLYYAGHIETLPKISSNTITLLEIIGCGLGDLPVDVFDELPNLEKIYFPVNGITSLTPGTFDQIPMLSLISLEINSIKQISSGTFTNLPSLVELRLDDNRITEIESGAFYNLPELASLRLDVNKLDHLLNDSLGYLPSLGALDVSDNIMTFLDTNIFQGCPALRGVDLAANELTSFEAGTFDELFVSVLLLDANLLTTLDESWLRTPLKKKNVVTISWNPLECGCDLAWLFAEPSLMTTLNARCGNGTDFSSLDPSYFSDNC